MKPLSLIILITYYLVYPAKCNGFSIDSTVLISIDPPSLSETRVIQNLNLQAHYRAIANIRIRSFLIKEEDSTPIYDLEFNDLAVNDGLNSFLLDFDKNTKLNQVDYSFVEVIKRFDQLPPGEYATYCTLVLSDSVVVEEPFFWYVDSLLSPNSILRKDINAALTRKTTKTNGKNFHLKTLTTIQANSFTNRINSSVAKRRNLTTTTESRGDKEFSALFYKHWFLGFYELLPSQSLQERIIKENKVLKNNPSLFIKNDLETFTNVRSQARKLNKKNCKDEPTGNIELTGNYSTGQEPGSMQNNNYEEVYANLNTELFKIPVVIEGYYTTQDNKRKAKASYIRIKYDVEKNKSELNNAVNGYKSKYNETQSKWQGIESIYTQLINRLTNEKRDVISSLSTDYGVKYDVLSQHGDLNTLISDENSDTSLVSSGGKRTSDSVLLMLRKNKYDIEKRYKQVAILQKKIDKYNILLQQYKKQQLFDSALVYSKLKDLTKETDVSNKQLSKAAEQILPIGKSSSFFNSLTRLNVGILNGYESRYTISGQTLKGGSIGYDLGIATIAASIGKTEYVSRGGEVDRYNSTMLRVDLHPNDKRSLGIIYYTCSPSKQIIQDNNFIHSDAGIPSFQKPTHIISVPYDAAISKRISIHGEGAFSYKRYDYSEVLGKDNTALQTSATYNIPVCGLRFAAEWEHVGRLFNNNALPFPKAATERYTLSTQADFFKSFLTAGIQFNRLQQETFSSTGRNVKWGFDLRTHSRRYPDIYLSYKPFSTFRKFDDTLSIAQRPLIGAVWLLRSSYQVNGRGIHHRFTLTYNKNTSIIDTDRYATTSVQAGYIVNGKRSMVNLSLGWMEQPQYSSSTDNYLTNYFSTFSINRNITDDINVSLGQDIFLARFGIQRNATTLGAMYAFKNKPLSLRLALRYTSYKQTEVSDTQKIWSCQIGCNWFLKPSNKCRSIK